ncbi:hypothetical protein [Emticicia sp. BO119]|uniref:hypothetical protein n=1 Tax=Emticicia sp. BO119 TaxID=2757768 RepID=UPI0015F0B679|nr:hypothetical protein [Emticicia sp. BO119]MBA4849445.1 hypothetical protein [Emticicia sp. BO119]
MKKTINSLKGDVTYLLERYDLLHEEINPSTTKDGVTVTFTRKNDSRKFQQFIHYLNAENINYYAYFCPIVKRIKVSIFLE